MRFFDSSHQKEPLSRLQNPADKQRLPAGKTKLLLILVLAVLSRNKCLNIGCADREESAEKLLGEGFGFSNDLQIEGVKVTAGSRFTRSLKGKILFFHALLGSGCFCFEGRKGFMHDRRKLRVVRHCERLQAAELPVGRFRVALISSLAPGCRNLCETRIEGNEDRKISHAEGDIDDLADFLRKPRTHLHDVSFIRAENADRTPRFIAAQAMTIRVMLGAGEMVAHQRLGILNGSLALGREEHGETAAGVRVLFKRRIEALLHYPDTRVVVSAVAVVVTCISLGKIEFTVGFRVVESLFDSKFNQVLRGHLVVGRRVISLEASLVAGGKIGVGWDTLRKPVVAGTGFKVPNLGFVNERYAKTFTAPLRFNDAAEFCSAFACGAAAAMDDLGRPRSDILGISMPGFGTSSGTRASAEALMRGLGIEFRTIDIRPACRQHFADIGHPEDRYDVVFENAQARERTQILMDVANAVGGLVLGTSDMSELALGWATFNGDHMSMYAVNAGVPKTLVQYLVRVFGEMHPELEVVLAGVLATEISPELLPPDAAGRIQSTEAALGPYALHDFFLYHVMKSGFARAKIETLAAIAFPEVDKALLSKTAATFFRRFYAQQFKRSSMPDGPKIGSVALSPRGDLRLPSDLGPIES